MARHPTLALPIARLRGHGEVLDDDTDLVIEGFPRCASSFAVAAFRLAQEPRAVRLAHHTHAPAQVLEAIRRGIPALVLAREPEEAICSLLVRTPTLGPQAALRAYLRFYGTLLPHRDGFVVGAFTEVVRDFGAVIRRVNERFGTRFREFHHTDANVARILREIEEDEARRRSGEDLERAIPRPSPRRAAWKDEVRAAYRRVPAPLRARAEEVFRAITADLPGAPGLTG